MSGRGEEGKDSGQRDHDDRQGHGRKVLEHHLGEAPAPAVKLQARITHCQPAQEADGTAEQEKTIERSFHQSSTR